MLPGEIDLRLLSLCRREQGHGCPLKLSKHSVAAIGCQQIKGRTLITFSQGLLHYVGHVPELRRDPLALVERLIGLWLESDDSGTEAWHWPSLLTILRKDPLEQKSQRFARGINVKYIKSKFSDLR